MKAIGPYEPMRFLGSGAFGGVYECRHQLTGENFAVKIVDIQTCLKADFYPHFKNELIIHSRIKHKSITQIHDVLIDKTNVYIVLEFCDGGDLNDVVQESGGLTEEEAKHYFHQIINALSYIHNLGIAHRDVKLENILVTVDDDAKLTDFGLCKQANGDDPMMTTCGTLVYAAPEIIREEPYNGMKADIWSAGIVLYAMVANHFPWIVDASLPPEKLMSETTRQILECNIDLPDGISVDLQSLLGSILTVDVDERPTAEDILQHPWFDGMDDSDDEDNTPDQNVIHLVETLIHDLDEKRAMLKK